MHLVYYRYYSLSTMEHNLSTQSLNLPNNMGYKGMARSLETIANNTNSEEGKP